MANDFKPLIDLIGKAAPALAAALGGPLAGAAVSVIADALGVADDPDAVTAAVASADPAVIVAQLAAAEARFKVEAEKAITLRTQIDAHVEMMRLDYGRGWFWGSWRPLAGWIATAWSAAVCVVAVRDIWIANYALMGEAGNLLMIGGPIMALAGVYSWQKSEERKAMAGGGLGRVVDSIRGAIGRR